MWTYLSDCAHILFCWHVCPLITWRTSVQNDLLWKRFVCLLLSPVNRDWAMSNKGQETLWCLAKQDMLEGLNPCTFPHLTKAQFQILDDICTCAHMWKHTSDSCLLSRMLNCSPARSAEVPKCWNRLCLVWNSSKHTSKFALDSVL